MKNFNNSNLTQVLQLLKAEFESLSKPVSESSDGLMLSEDKIKLDSLSTTTSWNALTDRPFYSETTDVYSTSVTVTANMPGYYRNTVDTLPDLVIGDTYIVTVDGVDYKLVAWMSDGYAPSLGDLILDGSGAYTEAPFYLCDTREDDNLCWFYTVLEGTTHTISISHEEVVKIDSKYLPDTLPKVTSEDEGSLLKVVDGAWKITPGITADDAMDILAEVGAVTPLADETGAVYTDENGVIYTL